MHKSIFTPIYTCHFGGKGNGLRITVNLAILRDLSKNQLNQLSQYIIELAETHLDPTDLDHDTLKQYVTIVTEIKKLVSPEDSEKLDAALISFFQQLFDLNPRPLEPHQIGFKHDSKRANYLYEAQQYMNCLLVKNQIATENTIQFSNKTTSEDFHIYFPHSDLKDFPLEPENYAQWETWSKTIPVDCLSEYLKHILFQLEQQDTATSRQIGKKIQALCTQIESRSQSLIVISMLTDLGEQCVSLSPPNNRAHVHIQNELDQLKAMALQRAYDIVPNEKKLKQFENELIEYISEKKEPQQRGIIQALKNLIETQAPANSPSTQQLKKYIYRIEDRLRTPAPDSIDRPIQTLLRSYSRRYRSERQKCKDDCLRALSNTMDQHPFRSTAFWYKTTYDSERLNEQHRELLRETYEPSLFRKHRFKVLIATLKQEESVTEPLSIASEARII